MKDSVMRCYLFGFFEIFLISATHAIKGVTAFSTAELMLLRYLL